MSRHSLVFDMNMDNPPLESPDVKKMIHIPESNLRWLILFLCCWISFGNYYAFDNPSSLNRQLMEWLESDFGTFQFQLTAMYSIYSVPNIILPLFIGGLLDKYGTSKLLIILSGLVCLGQCIFCIGVEQKCFSVILVGRLVFGLGGESLTVAQSGLVTYWFRGREFAFALGLTLSVARFGTVINNILSPGFSISFGIPGATWIGFYSCLCSFICTIITVILDEKYSEKGAAIIHHEEQYYTSFSKYCANVLRSTFEHMQTFHPAFAVVCIIAFCFYGALVPFNNIASDFLQYKYYGPESSTSAYVMSIPDTLAIFLVPILGNIVDRYGYKLKFLTFGGTCMTMGHYMLGFTSTSPKIALLFNGIANSTLLVLWPWIPNLVDEPYWGTAFGIVTICVNFAFTLVPFLVAHSLYLDSSYKSAEFLFILLTAVGTIFCLLLQRWNRQDKLGLDASEKVATIIHSNNSHQSFRPIELSSNLHDIVMCPPSRQHRGLLLT